MKKYIYIAKTLEQEIRDGVWPVGSKLPIEPELCARFEVARQTLRQAIGVLEEQGMVERMQGSGTYVRSVTPALRRRQTVCVMTTYLDDYIFPEILSGVEEVLSAEGYNTLMRLTRNRISTERQNLLELQGSDCSGLIIEGTKTALYNPNTAIYQTLTGTPVVFINGWSRELSNVSYVAADDYQGARTVTEHLIAKGHRAIGGIFKHDDIQGLKRHRGYLDALLEAGLPMEEENWRWFATEDVDMLFQSSLTQWLRQFSAVVCYNDTIAVRLIRFCQQAGLRVPEDLSVTGFDNSTLAELIGLTTVAHPGAELGRLAAEAVLQLMHDPETPIRRLLPVPLVERRTVADLRPKQETQGAEGA